MIENKKISRERKVKKRNTHFDTIVVQHKQIFIIEQKQLLNQCVKLVVIFLVFSYYIELQKHVCFFFFFLLYFFYYIHLMKCFYRSVHVPLETAQSVKNVADRTACQVGRLVLVINHSTYSLLYVELKHHPRYVPSDRT